MNSRFIATVPALLAVAVFLAASPAKAQAPAAAAAPSPTSAITEAEAEAAEIALKAEWKLLGDPKYDTDRKDLLLRQKPYTFPTPLPSLAEVQKIEQKLKLHPPMRPSLALTTTNQYIEAPVLEAVDGVLTTTLNVTKAINWIGKDHVKLRSYNGNLVGPTLRVKPGDTLKITVSNQLATEDTPDTMNTLHHFNSTNLHTHGLHVSPSGKGDNVLLTIDPGCTQDYEIKIPSKKNGFRSDHTCGTFWYHPHCHGSTAAQVASGMAGALIIEGGMDDIINVARERVMVLSQILYVTRDSVKAFNESAPDQTKQIPIPAEMPYGVIEEQYKSVNLGPNAAERMGRFTTINGVQLPVIHLRPGEIERWRLIDTTMGEILQLQLVKAASPTEVIPFNEIAVDGLPLGRVVKQPYIRMLSGNRSDVLVQIAEPGEYLLTDMAKLGMKANPLPTQYVARVVVSGDRVTDQKLPTDEQLKPYGMGTLMNEAKVGTKSATYGIILPKSLGAQFVIDGKTFSEDKADRKILQLNTVDEWTVSVQNDPKINTGHPFHIHVNPFQLKSIKGPKHPNLPVSDKNPIVELLEEKDAVWRDTIWVPNNGSVTFRTKYTDFTGKFVQHCHILDHEDQGMMQVIQVVEQGAKKTSSNDPPNPAPGTPAPGFDLLDPDGKHHRLQDMPASRRIVFFFKGHGCLHCAQQVREFTALHEQFKAKGIDLVGITSDDAATLKAALKEAPSPFLILPDAEAKAFAAYGCARSDGLLHGTFFLDEKGRVTWQTTGASPFLAVSQLLDGPSDQKVAASRPSKPQP